MALYNHLSSDQNIRLMAAKGRQDLLISVLIAGGVKIHPQHPGLGKPFLYHLLDLLGSRLEPPHVFGAAFRTGLFHGLLIAAVMAHQPPVIVLA